jgi:DDE superfamily endonuclease/Winged helix-turn helix
MRATAKKPLDEATKKRLRAGRMLLAGKRPAAALAVGVARQTVYTWKGLLDEGGIDALRAVPGRGRPARLDEGNWRNYGRRHCKARPSTALAPSYGRSSAWVCLSSGYLASSSDKRRSGAFLGQWVLAPKSLSGAQSSATSKLCATGSDTPGLRSKKAQREGRLIVFIDETGISERPTRVRTWAPKGQTPVIQFHFTWNHVSAIAGLSRTNYLFRLHEGSVKKEQVVEFLKALKHI